MKMDLRRISLDTPDLTDVVVPVSGIKHAVAIDFDPVDKFVYWSDDVNLEIKRCRMNGQVKLWWLCGACVTSLLLSLSHTIVTRGGLMASALVIASSSSGDALAGDIVLCSWARHLTLTVPLSTQRYKWVPANLMVEVIITPR